MRIIIINQQKKIPINKRATKTAVLKILKNLKVDLEKGELNIVYVDNKTIQELNLKFLGRPRPTDVLCFDLSEGGNFIADVVISTEKACENSLLFNTSPLWEMRLYLIHGILHLFGYNDRRKKDRMRMHRKAIRIMKQIGTQD